jgi:hypothetical protein
MGSLRQYGAGLKLVGRTLLLELFGKRLRTDGATPTDGQVLKYTAAQDAWEPGTVAGGGSLPAGTNGGVLAYAAGAWASTAAGTARQVLTSAGAGAASWGQDVLPLRIGSTLSTALPADAALGLQWAVRSLVVRDAVDSTWLDVWRVDGAGFWVYGTDNGTNSSGTLVLAPSGGELHLKRGATTHVGVASSGALTLGTTSHTTALQGSALTIGLSSVVALYQGGARVPERTVSSSTTLDAQDEVVFVDTTGGAVTLTLPAGAGGRVLAVQRIGGSNNVVVQRAGADTIRQGGTGALTSWTISDDSRHGLVYRSAATEWVAEA